MHEILVAHQVPGRLRLKLAGAAADPESLAQVESALLGLPGLSRMEVRAATRSVIIEYDADDAPHFPETLKTYASALGLSWSDLARPHDAAPGEMPFNPAAELLPTTSELAQLIVEFFKSLNREIMQASDNAVDLRVMLPFAVAVLGGMPSRGMQSTPLWMTSLMFAFTSFMTLHDELRSRLAAELLEQSRETARDRIGN